MANGYYIITYYGLYNTYSYNYTHRTNALLK